MLVSQATDGAARDQMMRRLRTAVQNPLLAADRRTALPPMPAVDAPAAEERLATWRREFEALAGHVHGPWAPATARDQMVALLRARAVRRILAWDDAALPVPDLLQHLAAAGIAAVTHSPDWTTRALADADEFTAGVTGTLAGLADTGSILVVSGPGRLRSASLVPPVLYAFLRVGDIYPDLAGWLQDADRMLRAAANIVVITGPSRTADIELNLVIGVHGPGEIHVVLVDR